MKKFILLAVVATFGLVSCKKDYTCSCTTTGTGGSVTQDVIINGKKNDAKDACEAGNTSGGGYTKTCTIK